MSRSKSKAQRSTRKRCWLKWRLDFCSWSDGYDSQVGGVRPRQTMKSEFESATGQSSIRFNRRMGEIQTWEIIGAKLAATKSALTTALGTLESAYANDYRDLTLFLDDGITPTVHSLTNGSTFGEQKSQGSDTSQARGRWASSTPTDARIMRSFRASAAQGPDSMPGESDSGSREPGEQSFGTCLVLPGLQFLRLCRQRQLSFTFRKALRLAATHTSRRRATVPADRTR